MDGASSRLVDEPRAVQPFAVVQILVRQPMNGLGEA